jgi:enediyne biosynthesis protein E5
MGAVMFKNSAVLKDARAFQIMFLGSFLTIGVLFRDFSVQLTQVGLVFISAVLTQRYWLRRLRLAQVGYLSAIVSSFGISILVRADNLWVHPLLAMLAISSKFVLRIDNSHVFNPANLAAVLAAYVLPGAWLSPGQWGQSWILAAWFFALGTIVTTKARRIDIGLVFLMAFAALLAARVFYLGQNPSIIWHQMQNGVLLLFAFFMISDPMTTPQHSKVRIGYACSVAALAFAWQFYFFKPHGPVLALFLLSFAVPWLNRLVPAAKFQWRPSPVSPEQRQIEQPLQIRYLLELCSFR